MKIRTLGLGALLVGHILCPTSQARAQSCVPEGHPRIALVLGGGGAKGIAHVGVLQVLERERVPAEVVLGTSMGAIVGGLYAGGLPLEDLEAAVSGIDWVSAFSDAAERKSKSYRRKQDDQEFLIKARLRLKNGRIQIPPGALTGRRVVYIMRELLGPMNSVEDFDDLPLPFRAIATDLESGDTVVLDSGDVALAMRASMSVPGAFVPLELGDRTLIDGGIAQNLPVSVAQTFDPDVVIAVDVGTALQKAEDVESAFGVLNQMLNILMRRQTGRDIELLGPDDLLISPDMGDVGTGSFEAAQEAIDPGVAATERWVERLRELALGEDDWRRYTSCRTSRREVDPPVIAALEVQTDELDQRFVTQRLSAEVGEPLDVARLDKELDRIFGLDHFETVDYDLIERDGETVLAIDAPRRQWGTNYIRLGMDLADDFEGTTGWDLGGRFTATQLNRWGLELRADGRIGENQLALGELYQPIRGGHWFVAPRAGWRAETERLFVDGDEIARYRSGQWEAALDVGRALGSWGEVRLGYQWNDGRASLRVGPPELDSFDYRGQQVYLHMGVDTLDSPNFPSSGQRAFVEAVRLFEDVFEEADTDVLFADWSGFGRFGRWSYGGGLTGGTILQDENLVFPFTLGGFLRLSGLARDELFGRHLALARVLAYRTLVQDSLIGMPIYAGFSLETGNTWFSEDDISASDLIYSGSLFLGVDSFLGPIVAGAGITDDGRSNYYFLVGRRF